MKKNAKTANVAGKGTVNVLNVKSEKPQEKKFDTKHAEVVTPIEEVKAEEKPQEQPQTEAKPKEQPTPQTENQVVTTTTQEPTKQPTLQEFKDRATILFLLQEKHTKLLEKKNRLDHFAVSHDNQNAEIIIRDANGEEFRSSSPKTIGQFIEFCKAEFSSLITETESNLIRAFAV